MIDRRTVLASAALLVAGSAWSAPKKAQAPRDLTGLWSNASYTGLQRDKAFKTLVVTPAEAEAYEAPRRALNGEVDDVHDTLGQATSEFPDNGAGLARIRGEIRSSWIIEPADGRIPWSAAGRERMGLDKHGPEEGPPETFDNVETRPTDERCLTASGFGAPLLNTHDTNSFQIVQTPGAVVIVSEKNHDARIIRVGGAPLSAAERTVARGSWMGVSVGRWEGATLVVETTGLRPGVTKLTDALSLTDGSRVVERFARDGPDAIAYRFEVEDPNLFSRPFRGEMIFTPLRGHLYEYACHEGNYSLPTILRAARLGRQGAAAGP